MVISVLAWDADMAAQRTGTLAAAESPHPWVPLESFQLKSPPDRHPPAAGAEEAVRRQDHVAGVGLRRVQGPAVGAGLDVVDVDHPVFSTRIEHEEVRAHDAGAE